MKPQKSNWHNQPLETLTSALQIDVQQGLTDIQAEQRLKQYGLNCLTPQRGKSPLRLLFEQVNQPLVYILLLAAAITGFLEEWVDSSVIFGVVLVNTMSLLQNYRTIAKASGISSLACRFFEQ